MNQNTISIEQALAQAQAHWNAGQVSEAERLCQHVLAVWPGQSDAMHLMGLMAHAYGNLDIAIDHLRRACQVPRVAPIYLSNLAEMCRQRGLLVEGEEAARRAVGADNALIAGWNNLGIIQQEAGKLEESLVSLERVVALQPDYAEARNNLGNTLKRLGRLNEAKAQYEEALRLAPAYVEAMSNLANLLTDLGDFDDAIAMARRAIETNPTMADAYINAAAAEVARHRYFDALRWIDAMLAFAPLNVGALGVRATVLRHLDRLDEALAEARRAVAIAPENGEAHNILGEVLQALDHGEEALAAFERAGSLVGFATEKAMLNRGVLMMERGDKVGAQQAFEQLIGQFPRSVPAWFNYADMHHFSPEDPAIGAMESLMASGKVQALGDRTALNFALGKAWLDAGNPERAFACLDEGNRLKRSSFAFDIGQTLRWMEDIAAKFSAEAMGRPVKAQVGGNMPIFVIGMPRSGTTLIEQILGSHPAIKAGGELSHISLLANNAGPFPVAAANLSAEQEMALGDEYLRLVRSGAGHHRHVVDKMPSNFLHAGFIHRILPDARIIHVRRDPVDTCLSCYTKLFTREQMFTYDMGELGRFYRGYEKLMEHWRDILPADRFIEVAYEDVVANLEAEAKRLVDFIGLDWDPACMMFHKTKRTIRTASMNQARDPLFSSSVGRWRPLAPYLGPLLTALGVEAPQPEAAKPRASRKPRMAKAG